MTGVQQEKDTKLHIPASDLAVIAALKKAYSVGNDGKRHEWRVSTPFSEDQKALPVSRSKWIVRVKEDGEVYLLQSLRTVRGSERDQPLILKNGTRLEADEYIGAHYVEKGTEGYRRIDGQIPNDIGLYWSALKSVSATLAWNEMHPDNRRDVSTEALNRINGYSFNREDKIKDGREKNVEISTRDLGFWVENYSSRVDEYTQSSIEGNRSSVEG